MEWYELGSILPFYLHPSRLQADYLVSPDGRPIAWRAPIDKFHLGLGKIKLGIMPQTKEKGVTCPHGLIILRSILTLYPPSALLIGLHIFALPVPSSHSPGSILQVVMRQSSLISAHLAAHINGHAIFAAGLGHITASGTIAEETGHC
jgi:hypothetical protein